MAAKKITVGKYKHYKGDVMKVIGTALHSESLEPLVVYEHKTKIGNLWARPLSMFKEKVFFEGKKVSRFTLLPAKGTKKKTKK